MLRGHASREHESCLTTTHIKPRAHRMLFLPCHTRTSTLLTRNDVIYGDTNDDIDTMFNYTLLRRKWDVAHLHFAKPNRQFSPLCNCASSRLSHNLCRLNWRLHGDYTLIFHTYRHTVDTYAPIIMTAVSIIGHLAAVPADEISFYIGFTTLPARKSNRTDC